MKFEVESGVFEKELQLLAETVGPKFEHKLADLTSLMAALKGSKIILSANGTLKVKVPAKFDRAKLPTLYTAALALFGPALAECTKEFGKFDILIEE